VEIMERERITHLVGVPAMFAALLAAIERRGGGFAGSALRLCLCGGAVLGEELQARWAERTGVELRQGYGLTEASPVVLFNDLRAPNRRGSLGTTMPGVQVSVRDPRTGALLADGREGEICVAGETVFAGYVGGATTGLQVRDGWLHTGDLAVRDAAGVHTFRGVRKRMFTRNGFNVYPAELERVFGAMPGVRGVRVDGIPDPASEHGIEVTLEGRVTEAGAEAWAHEHLATYKRPTRLRVRPAG
jgi:long-chain acyl-CoA synthetase